MKIKINFSKKADEAQSPAQIIASIDDLLTEILLRLPIKSLIRFELVSKHWQSIITSQDFVIRRNPKPNPAIGLFLPCWDYWTDQADPSIEYVSFSVKIPTNPPFRKLKFIEDTWANTIFHSCNGLLLCRSLRALDRISMYYVYNPSTKKFTVLPELQGGAYGILPRVHGMSLAFDPAKSPHYKVVCVWGSELEETGWYEYRVEVYSSKTGRWSICYGPFRGVTHFESGVYWNGAIHWFSYWTAESLYFNLGHQMLEKMPMPPIPDDRDKVPKYYFGESCDHLHYIEIFGPQIQFNVYEMNRDYSEWFVKYRIDLSPFVAATPGLIRDDIYDPTHAYYYFYSVFTLVRGEKEEDAFLVLQIPGKAIRYNIVDKAFETVCEFGGDVDEDFLKFEGMHGFQYIESFCSV